MTEVDYYHLSIMVVFIITRQPSSNSQARRLLVAMDREQIRYKPLGQ